MNSSDSVIPQRIRSFIRRQGRITPGQQHALNTLSEIYCLEPGIEYNFHQIFSRDAPLFLEIGFGNGDCLATMANAHRDCDFIGVEVHKPGIGRLMAALDKMQLTNVRIFCHDAVEILEQFMDNSLDGIHLFFPDPWPKKKHHKRRIVSNLFISLVTRKLKPEGYFHAATDWENYAVHMLEVLNKNPALINVNSFSEFSPKPDYRPMTHFEKRGLNLGHNVRDLIFKKQ